MVSPFSSRFVVANASVFLEKERDRMANNCPSCSTAATALVHVHGDLYLQLSMSVFPLLLDSTDYGQHDSL